MKQQLNEYFKENGLVFLAFMYGAALFTILAAIFNWEWFFTHPKSAFMVSKLGRNGARIFYIVMGIFIAILATLAVTSGQVKL